jgi:hypothetical protein
VTAAAEQRRRNREKRREIVAAANGSEERARGGDPWTEIVNMEQSGRERVGQASPRAAAIGGAVVGVAVAVGVVAAARWKNRNDGNSISGEVAVHLLNRIELLTIRLQVRHAARRVPTEIDVHRVGADTSSRASAAAQH